MPIPNLTSAWIPGLADLELQSLETVNLITGKNNAGSSVLEAIALFAHNAAPRTIENLLRTRGEVPEFVRNTDRLGRDAADTPGTATQDVDSPLAPCSTDFRAWEAACPVVISTTDGTEAATTELKMSSLPFNGEAI